MLSETPILSLDSLSKTFTLRPAFGRATKVHALRNVSLDLMPGRALALVGESGSGKSTVGRMIVGHHTLTSGRILFEGQDIAELTTRADQMRYRQAVQMVFQDPYGSLHPRKTIDAALSEPLAIHGIGNRGERVEAMLAAVGLDQRFRFRFPHQLSGGQRQRVMIATSAPRNTT